MSRNGAVACGHAATADAAEAVLREGGNAFDAVIAAFFMACAVEPVLASLGGGGFLLAAPAGEPPRLFDFFAHTPRRKRPAAELDFEHVQVDFGATCQSFHIGYGAAATPGAVRGMWDVHRALGRMPMRELAGPALAILRAGAELTALQAHVLSLVEPIYITRDTSRQVFGSGRQPGRVRQAGESLSMPGLADTLESLAIEGDDLFYRGEIAALIEAACAAGGHLSRADLAGYRTERRTPLEIEYHGARIATNPPPAVGGVLIGIILGLLADQRTAPFGSAARLALLAGALHVTNLARDDGGCVVDRLARLAGGDQLAPYRRLLAERWHTQRGTTHISILDQPGNAASLTVSNGEGCGELVAGTGVMLNNMLGEGDLNPAGLHAWPTDRRIGSMMAPTLAFCRDGRRVVTGSGGSNRIRSAIAQVLINLIDHDLDAERAVQHPRLHVDAGVLYAEGGFEAGALTTVATSFADLVRFDGPNFFFGGAHTLVQNKDAIDSAGDPRRGGVSRVF